jgi:crossover junction endodeoxyribonuclease RuvC
LRILGLDPGIARTGYAFIENGKCLSFGIIKTDKNKSLNERIFFIVKKIEKLINNKKPQFCVIETFFFKLTTAKSIIFSLHLRGAIFYLLTKKKIPVVEVTPTKVKLAICGNGRAAKRQIKYMIKKIFNLEDRLNEDSADALAVAYTGYKEIQTEHYLKK